MDSCNKMSSINETINSFYNSLINIVKYCQKQSGLLVIEINKLSKGIQVLGDLIE